VSGGELLERVHLRHRTALFKATNLPVGESLDVGLRQSTFFSKPTDGTCVSSSLSSSASFMFAANVGIGVLTDGIEVDVNVRLGPADPAAALAHLELRELVSGHLCKRRDLGDRNLEPTGLAAPHDEVAFFHGGRRDQFLLGTLVTGEDETTDCSRRRSQVGLLPRLQRQVHELMDQDRAPRRLAGPRAVGEEEDGNDVLSASR
jgi:hypothetical protein